MPALSAELGVRLEGAPGGWATCALTLDDHTLAWGEQAVELAHVSSVARSKATDRQSFDLQLLSRDGLCTARVLFGGPARAVSSG